MFPETVDPNKLPKKVQEVINHSSFKCASVCEFENHFGFYTESGYLFCTIEKNGMCHLEEDGKTVDFKINMN